MLYSYITEKLVGLQGFTIKNVTEDGNIIYIHGELQRRIHCCLKLQSRTLFFRVIIA